MQTLMWGLNTVYDREETRGFVKKRLTALAMVWFRLLASLWCSACSCSGRSSRAGSARRSGRVVRGLAVVDCRVAPPDRRRSVRVREDPLPGTERRPSPLALRDVRDGISVVVWLAPPERSRSMSASSPRTTRPGGTRSRHDHAHLAVAQRPWPCSSGPRSTPKPSAVGSFVAASRRKSRCRRRRRTSPRRG